jgi:hypothetical protein
MSLVVWSPLNAPTKTLKVCETLLHFEFEEKNRFFLATSAIYCIPHFFFNFNFLFEFFSIVRRSLPFTNIAMNRWKINVSCSLINSECASKDIVRFWNTFVIRVWRETSIFLATSVIYCFTHFFEFSIPFLIFFFFWFCSSIYSQISYTKSILDLAFRTWLRPYSWMPRLPFVTRIFIMYFYYQSMLISRLHIDI